MATVFPDGIIVMKWMSTWTSYVRTSSILDFWYCIYFFLYCGFKDLQNGIYSTSLLLLLLKYRNNHVVHAFKCISNSECAAAYIQCIRDEQNIPDFKTPNTTMGWICAKASGYYGIATASLLVLRISGIPELCPWHHKKTAGLILDLNQILIVRFTLSVCMLWNGWDREKFLSYNEY